MTILKKGEFITAIAEGFSTEDKKVTKKDAELILETFSSVIEELVFGQQVGVRLGEIGTFKVATVPERDHRNPKTGDKITKREHYALKFQVNSAFKRDLAEVRDGLDG